MKAHKYQDIGHPIQFHLQSPSIIMSSHLLLVVILLVSFQTSYARPDSIPSRSYSFHSSNPKASSVSSQSNFAIPYKQSFLSTSSFGTGDIIEQTRTQAESLKTTLRSLTNKPEAATILKKVFSGKNGGCITNMDEAIKAIETGTRLVENGGTEIKQLVQLV